MPYPQRVWLLLLTLAASTPALALQVIDARDGETVLARISRQEVTRITLAGERIRKVTGNAGEFVLEKDEEQGEIFIRPVSPESTKPINLFVSSERSTIGLLLQPLDTPSDTIVIREAAHPMRAPARTGQSERHVRTLKSLLLVMAEDTQPEDLEVREASRRLALWPGAALTLERQWLGRDRVGERYSLTNTGTSSFHLTEPDLYQHGVIAVSIERTTLAPGASTPLFVIRERRGDD